jgi:paraquat-inducible protein A
MSSVNQTIADEPGEPGEKHALRACPGCDLLITPGPIPDEHYLSCLRCGTTVAKTYKDSVNRVLALSSAGLLLYIPAMLLPLMTLSSLGIDIDGNVIDTCVTFYNKEYYVVALVMVLTAVLFPFLKLFIPFIVSVYLKGRQRPAWLKSAFKLHKHLEEWGMVEVYLLGILITLIKMSDMASIEFNAGFYCFIGLVLLSIAISAHLDEDLYWEELDYPHEHQDSAALDRVGRKLALEPSLQTTAAAEGLIRCHDCALLIDASENPDGSQSVCPRCSSDTHLRKKGSVTKTWALVLTALILFFPANMLPIMRVDFLGVPERSTILDGILYFFKHGSIGIGLIILTASILVPLFKVVGMFIILLTIKFGRAHFLRQKAKMFRFIGFIGRWSMLDIFVVALLTVLVNFGFLTSIHTAPGATYFTLVVITTMVAALEFDPRIMWDRCDPTVSYHLAQRGDYGQSAGS